MIKSAFRINYFRPKEFFTTVNRQIKLNLIDTNFREYFLKEAGKIEEITTDTVRMRKLSVQKETFNSKIIESIGGEIKIETMLQKIASLLEKQPNGEKGKLLTTDERLNVFYSKDVSKKLRFINIIWTSDGWKIMSGSISKFIPIPSGSKIIIIN